MTIGNALFQCGLKSHFRLDLSSSAELVSEMRFVNPIPFVSDIERSKAFYRDVMGLQILSDFGSGFDLEELREHLLPDPGATENRAPQRRYIGVV